MTVAGPSRISRAPGGQSNPPLLAAIIAMAGSYKPMQSSDHNSPVTIIPRLLKVYDLEQTSKTHVYKYKPFDTISMACKLSSRKRSLLFL